MPSYVITSASGGGHVVSSNPTYLTARTGSGLSANTGLQLVGQLLNAGTYTVYEAFTSFDTSVIPAAETIIDAVLALRVQTDNSTTDFTVQARTSLWTPSGLTTADWVAGASLGVLALLATLDSSTVSAVPATYSCVSSGSNLVDAINKSGTTDILLCSDRLVAGTAPSGDERLALNVSAGQHTLTVTTADINPLRVVSSSQRW